MTSLRKSHIRHEKDASPSTIPRTLTSVDLVKFLVALPRADRPSMVVLDNARIHKSKRVQHALPRLRRRRVRIFYLPAYAQAPERNEIEAVFGVIKGHDLAARSYVTGEILASAVRRAQARSRSRLKKK